jgi:hypothetical protein
VTMMRTLKGKGRCYWTGLVRTCEKGVGTLSKRTPLVSQ